MHHYLFVNEGNKDEYTLKQYFGLVFEDLVAEDYELRVILPEGAKDIQVFFFFIFNKIIIYFSLVIITF